MTNAERDDGANGSSGGFLTLDDSIEEVGRARTMAELKRELESDHSEGQSPSEPGRVRPRVRDDELLDDLPPTDHHLGRFGGWRAARKVRWVVGITLGLALLAAAIAFLWRSHELKQARLHPLPEVEATIAPGTPREITYTDGSFRVAISRDAPAVNLVHLPDRDITLGRWAEKAQFKVEIRDGKTLKIKVLTGEIVETLTSPDAVPLLD
jgi:hypothetical protein